MSDDSPSAGTAARPDVHRVADDPYLHWPDGSLAMCDNHPTEEAMEVTEYANTGWRLECSDCYEVNYDFNT